MTQSIVLARSWADTDGTEYAAGAEVQVDADTAGQLIRDGRARAAGAVGEEAVQEQPVDQNDRQARGSRFGRDASAQHDNPDSPATGDHSEGVS